MSKEEWKHREVSRVEEGISMVIVILNKDILFIRLLYALIEFVDEQK